MRELAVAERGVKMVERGSKARREGEEDPSCMLFFGERAWVIVRLASTIEMSRGGWRQCGRRRVKVEENGRERRGGT